MKKVFLVAFTLLCLWNVKLLAQRDPYLRPFANNSIWNMAIHKDAVYVDAKMNAPTAWGVTSDPEILILSPTSPETGIFKCGWAGSTRCDKGAKISSGPIPDGWINGIPEGTPNNSTSILANDGHTIINLQCLHRCATTGPASSLYAYPSGDLYTDGIQGGHGGSGMSALGGSIRCGELTPNYTEAQIIADSNIYIQHVIKMNVNTKLYVSKTSGGYRWPAVKADGNYNSSNACDYYGGSVPQFRMGSLLAIPQNVDVEAMGLKTGPGIIMARTLQKYGAYLVDATCWDVVAFEVQTGPHGDVESQFKSKYGYTFSPQSTSGAWAKDVAKIVQELFVVDNNNAANIGGGPTTDLVNRLAPAICDIGTPGSGIYNCGLTENVPVTGAAISPASTTVSVNNTVQLTANILPVNATNTSVTWASSNNAIATVSITGLVTGKAVGSDTITLTTVDGNITATAVIKVTAGSTGSLKIHCIGNSLTQDEPGYRGVLKNKLAADGYTFSYVGRKTDGTSSHSGYGGYTVGPGTSKVGNIYDSWTAGPNLNGVDCDIIILEIGINDYFNVTEANYNPENPAAAKLDGLISLIYSTKPDVAIYVSNLTPVAWDANAFSAWNAKVPVIVKKYTDLGKKCYLADVRNGISWNVPTDIGSDQLHPTAAGYTKMGNYYASLLETINTVGVRETRESQKGTLSVYPNPVTDNMLNLTISGIANHEAINISLFDFSGKLIKNVKLQSVFDSENNVALNLENVNSGFYMLQVQSGTNAFSSKIIKR